MERTVLHACTGRGSTCQPCHWERVSYAACLGVQLFGRLCRQSADHGDHVRSDMVAARGGVSRAGGPRGHVFTWDNWITRTPNPNTYVTPVQFPGTYMTTWAGTHVRRAGSTYFIVS